MTNPAKLTLFLDFGFGLFFRLLFVSLVASNFSILNQAWTG